MTCEGYESLIARQAEGDLAAEDAARVEEHLAACVSCRAFAESLRETREALEDLGREEIDAAALAAVRQGVGAALDAGDVRSARRRFLSPMWTWAAAAALAVVAVLLQRPDPRGRPEPPEAPSTPMASLAAPSSAPPAAGPSTAPITAPSVAEPPAPRRTPSVHRTARASARPPVAGPSEPKLAGGEPPLLIKLVTADPDIVIYWLVEQNGGKS